MASIADSNYTSTKTYNDGEILDEADLDTTNNYIQSYINARKNDLVRLANDAQGSDYTLDGTATRLYTNSLFEKQHTQGQVNLGSDIDIGVSADTGFVNVSSGVAVVSMTPERTGTYKIAFDFTHIFNLNTALNAQCVTGFRFSDGGVLNSPLIVSGGLSQDFMKFWHPVHLELQAELEAGTAYNFFLQKKVINASSVATNVVGASNNTGYINFSIEKI